jgi:hypothetical protein
MPSAVTREAGGMAGYVAGRPLDEVTLESYRAAYPRAG